MKFLVIGGTRFVGYNFIKTVLAQGHEVTMFNRGKNNPNAFDGKVETIIGDRDGEISKIGNRHFDIVFDSCGYIPRVVKQSVDYLKDKASWYVFVSTISVYEGLGPNRDESGNYIFHDESSPVSEVDDKTTEEDEYYGALKALCEHVVQDGFPNRSILLRCGHIIGPHDYGTRFMYWILRIKKGNEVLAPGEKTLKYQFIDVRDICDFTLKLLDGKKGGTYNVTGPKELFDFKKMLLEIKEVTNSNTEFVWASDQFLLDNHVEEYTEFSMWYTRGYKYMFACDISKALANGLKFTPFKQTVIDTLKWYDKVVEYSENWKIRLSEDKEKALIEKLHASKS